MLGVINRASSPEPAENREKGEFGTDHAIYCSGKSVAHSTGQSALNSHGGARLRADRTSDHLTIRQAQIIIAAVLAADRIGQPFTRMVTVHWDRAGIPDKGAATATGRLTKLIADWGRRRGGRVLWAWVRENDAGKGSHLHLLIACPPDVPIGRMWRRWLRSITDRPYRAGVINTRRIAGTLSAPESNPANYRQNLANVVAYVCKGVRPDYGVGLGITRLEYGGSVIGKRSAVCQSLLKESRASLAVSQCKIAKGTPWSNGFAILPKSYTDLPSQ